MTFSLGFNRSREHCQNNINRHFFGVAGLAPLVLVLTLVGARAADIEPSGAADCPIVLTGPITSEDADRVEELVRARAFDSICLNSPGGSYDAGSRLAKTFMFEGVRTVVRREDQCLSACAMAFMGGSSWGDLRHPDRTLEVGGTLGFHAPYVRAEADTENTIAASASFALAVRLMRDFLNDKSALKITDAFITGFFLHFDEAKPHSVRVVETVGDAARANVTLTGYRTPAEIGQPQLENACALLFETRKEDFEDLNTAWIPEFTLNPGEFEKRVVDPDYMIGGVPHVLVATVADWAMTWQQTAACAFSRQPQNDARGYQVEIWSNMTAEEPDITRALRHETVFVPAWYFYPAEMLLAEISE